MTQSMIRRTLKNLVQNFSEAEVKVREATSNDPWGPSSSQMSDISDLTYNVVACNEILGMVWKRLNDDKNWRHVYKSLTLLEYLLKTGSDRVSKQSQENMHIVKPLTEYRFVDKDGKDQGVNVREKAKVVLVLIEDEEKRKEEREFAMKTKDKLAAASSDSTNKTKTEIPPYVGLPSLDNIPSVADLTASMAKKREQQQEMEKQRKEEERLAKMGDAEPDLWEQATTAAPTSSSDPWGAPSNALKDTGPAKNDPWGTQSDVTKGVDSPTCDPWGEPVDKRNEATISSTDPWGGERTIEKQSPPTKNDPWGDMAKSTEDNTPASNDPWGTNDLTKFDDSKPSNSDPWEQPLNSTKASNGASLDPWETQSDPAVATTDPWVGEKGTSEMSSTDPFGDRAKPNNDPWSTSASPHLPSNDPWGSPAAPPDATTDPFGDGRSSDIWGTPAESNLASGGPTEEKKNPGSFLEEGGSLVDLNTLMSVNAKPTNSTFKSISAYGQITQGKEE